MLCAYCRAARGVHQDHVIPASLQRKLRRMGRSIPAHLKGTVFACGACNWRKLTRRLIPMAWAAYLDEINELIPWGTRFRVWDGSATSLREVGSR